MATYKMYEYNHETGVERVREATDAETQEIEANAKASNADFLAVEADAKAKETQKIALLKKLGITADEAMLLSS